MFESRGGDALSSLVFPMHINNNDDTLNAIVSPSKIPLREHCCLPSWRGFNDPQNNCSWDRALKTVLRAAPAY